VCVCVEVFMYGQCVCVCSRVSWCIVVCVLSVVKATLVVRLVCVSIFMHAWFSAAVVCA